MRITHPQTLPQITTILGNLTVNVAFLTVILVMAGAYQLFAVNWLVGRNFFGLERKTYSIEGDTKKIDNILKFLTIRGYKRYLGPNEEIMYKNRINDQVIIGLGSNSTTGNSTLSTVTFHRGIYSVEPSEAASELRDSALFELRARLTASDSSIKMDEVDTFDDPTSLFAYKNALSYTVSKIPAAETFGAILERISAFYRAIILITIGTLIGISIVYWVQLTGFDFNTYITITVGLLISLFIEVGIPLREELGKKKNGKN
jgi:hypothetical protein